MTTIPPPMFSFPPDDCQEWVGLFRRCSLKVTDQYPQTRARADCLEVGIRLGGTSQFGVRSSQYVLWA